MTTETKCRSCGGEKLSLVLSLGQSPLANALLTPAELSQKEETFPLDLVFCETCTLLQITETVPPEKLFREYLYFSSFSDTMVKHAEIIANRLVDEEKLGANSLAMEIASNDGYLLQHYKKRGVPVLGIEPAGKRFLVLKSRIQYKPTFVPIARGVVECDGVGVTSSDYSLFRFRKLPTQMQV